MPAVTRMIHPLLVALTLMAAAGTAQDKRPTPSEQFQALRKEYNRMPGPPPKTDAERMQYIGRVYKHHNEVAVKFLALAEKHPKDAIALDALIQAVWHVNTIPWPVEVIGEDTARPIGFEIIIRDHIQSEKLGPLCQRVSYGFAKEYEAFLRAIIAKNPHKHVQAAAKLSLGHYLHNRLQRVELLREQPEQAKEFDGLYGKEYMAALQKRDRQKEFQEVEAIFEKSIKEHGDVKLPDGEMVADRAKMELYEIRNLSVGRVAPDIEAEDQHGKRFKLSDYRGKVVLLDFWSYV